MNRRPLRDVAFLYAATGSSQFFVAITYVFCARMAGASQFGVAALAVSLALLSASFVDFGGALHALRERTSDRWDEERARDWVGSKLRVVAGVSALSLLPAVLVLHDPLTAGGASLYLLGTASAAVLAVPLRSKLAFGRIAVIQVTSRAVPACAVLVCWLAGAHSALLLVAALAVGSLVEAAGYAVMHRRDRFARLRDARWVNPFSGTLRIGLNTASGGLGNLDVTLVTAGAGAAAAGEYAAVNRWAGAMGLVSTAVAQAFFPRLSAAKQTDRRATLLTMLLPILAFVPVLAAVAIFAGPICAWVLGPGYPGSGAVLALLAAAVTASMFCNAFNSALLAWGFETIATVWTLAGLGTQLVGQFVFSRMIGAPGAPLGSLTGQIVTLVGFAACALLARRAAPRRRPAVTSVA